MIDHLTFEQLCDLADNALDGVPTDSARDHLRQCDECAATYASLGELSTAAASLPRGITPPEDLWADIQREIAPSRARSSRRTWTLPVGWLAAAGIVIAVASSAATILWVRGGSYGSVACGPGRQGAECGGATPAPALPAQLASTEVRYTRDVDVLQRTLAERRDSLVPSTVETIERSLRVADSAIAEARAALAHDPSNAALAALFSSNYERKIDLLKRATELAPRT